MARTVKQLKKAVMDEIAKIPRGKTFTLSDDVYEEIQVADETPDTAELKPIEQVTEPITFVIFETVVHGALIFHPGQERALLDAFDAGTLPVEAVVVFLEMGGIRGRFPKLPTIEKKAVITFGTGN